LSTACWDRRKDLREQHVISLSIGVDRATLVQRPNGVPVNDWATVAWYAAGMTPLDIARDSLLASPFKAAVEEARQDVEIARRRLSALQAEVEQAHAALAVALDIEERAIAAYDALKPGDEVPLVLIPKRAVRNLAAEIEYQQRRAYADAIDTSQIKAALDEAGLFDEAHPGGRWHVSLIAKVDGECERVELHRYRKLPSCQKRAVLNALQDALRAYVDAWQRSAPDDECVTAGEAAFQHYLDARTYAVDGLGGPAKAPRLKQATGRPAKMPTAGRLETATGPPS
jgi:hypothetical protein